jgi:thioesterase domain-containing protein
MPVAEVRASLTRIAKTVTSGIQRRVSNARLPRTLKNVRSACELAARTYVPRTFPGRLILFRSKHKPLMQFRDPHASWAACAADGLEIHEIEGDHDNILLEPQVRFVAEQLKSCFDGVQTVNRMAQ